MIKIKKAKKTDIEVLALLGRLTWAESHGPYIEDKNILAKYLDENFSIAKTKENLYNSKNIFYILYVDNFPAGYAKIILNEKQEHIASENNCRLERIFILYDFIPLKIGKQLLNYIEEQAKVLELDTIWLSVYIKNTRAIRFYEKNYFRNAGDLDFIVNGKKYENIVFSKTI
jgi:GNAT superfamily N-acetyltransferase